MTDVDVLIVGAGPAGACTAILLVERGFKVMLIDRARFPRPKACAEFVNPGAIRVLDRLGLLESVQASGAALFRGMRVVSPGGQTLGLDFQAHAGQNALGLSRRVLDQLAVERCRSLGVEVIEGTRVRNVLREGNHVIGVEVSEGSNRRRTISSGIVVGADGHHSAVSRSLGLDITTRWPRRIGLAAHYADFPLYDGFGEMHVGTGGYCGVAPQEDGIVNVAMVVDLGRFEQRSGSVSQFFEAELDSYRGLRGRAATAHRATQVRGVGPLARRVKRVAGSGFLLVGDAAGFFDPFTGEGIVDALLGGEMAADAIATALERRDTSSSGLAGYVQAREVAFTSKRRAARLVQVFVRSPILMDYAIGRIGRRPSAVSTLTGVFGDYRDAAEVLSPRFLLETLRP